MICYFNAVSGQATPVVVDSTMVAAVNQHAQGSTQLLTTGGPILVDVDVQDAIVALGWPPFPAPTNIDVPHVTGDGVVGEVLTCTTGNWNGEPTSYSYQWLSDAIQVGTNSDAYTVAGSDAGQSLTCVVTATNAGGSTVAPPSNAVAVPAAH